MGKTGTEILIRGKENTLTQKGLNDTIILEVPGRKL